MPEESSPAYAVKVELAEVIRSILELAVIGLTVIAQRYHPLPILRIDAWIVESAATIVPVVRLNVASCDVSPFQRKAK